MNVVRCGAAHPDDRSVCEGPVDAVRLVDRRGDQVTGCVHHGARMLASLSGGRVYPGPGADHGCAVDVFRRAADLEPFCWLRPR